MFWKNKSENKIDSQQLAMIEHARKRIRQKRGFHNHFIISIFLIVCSLLVNFLFNYQSEFTLFNTSWSYVISAILGVILVIHFLKVYVFYTFMGKVWESKHMEFLIEKQAIKVEKLKRSMDKEALLKAQSEWNNENQNRNVTIIAAAAENNVIGRNNDLIWHLSDDLKHFKNLTKGHHVIMGRKTFESIPKALPNRTNVVITRQKNYFAEGAIVVNSIESALALCLDDNRPFIIGGGEIYRQAMALADCIELTRVHENFEGDTFFPNIDNVVWQEVWRENHDKDDKHNYAFSFIRYKKRKQ